MRITENQLRSIIRRIIKESTDESKALLNDPIVVRAQEVVKEMLDLEQGYYTQDDFERASPTEAISYFLNFYFGLSSYGGKAPRARLEAFIDTPKLERDLGADDQRLKRIGNFLRSEALSARIKLSR
jgi:hypothetical protein